MSYTVIRFLSMMVLSKILPVMQLLFYRSKNSDDLVMSVQGDLASNVLEFRGNMRVMIRSDGSHNLVSCLLYMKIYLWCLYLLFTRKMVCSVLFYGCDSIPYQTHLCRAFGLEVRFVLPLF